MSFSAPWTIALRGNERSKTEMEQATAEMTPSDGEIDVWKERMHKLLEIESTDNDLIEDLEEEYNGV
ncbi:hypothetical protein M422DRAFT_252525 [Sphaerobolus stellatus SS14]|uniref:Unplaced genomic scaffold SPHSTscaffold_44, whole genome shotgun sequence n=1 Tax=Sphaerobolus stellatus (strain SS14) TaxID=990650 RepID=A0A0C9VYF4_SPHS4|nr:hypothetical protein M422DRAFT_252525 [Sphaerobolus stellatus SS14]